MLQHSACRLRVSSTAPEPWLRQRALSTESVNGPTVETWRVCLDRRRGGSLTNARRCSSSVTHLYHRRLVDWANGEMTVLRYFAIYRRRR